MYLNDKILILICALVLGFLETAHAQVYFEETFFPVYVNKNDVENPGGGSATKAVPTESGLGYDLRTTLAYQFPQYGLIFGATYNYYSVDTSRVLTPDYEGLKTSTQKQEYGPTLGIVWGGWKFLMTYFFNAEKSASQHYIRPTPPDQDETYKNTGGSGYQVAVGYGLNLGAGFEIGPSLIYRSITYPKQSLTVRAGSSTPYATTTLQTKAIDSELKPMVTVSFRY